jgi:hypothetical protein
MRMATTIVLVLVSNGSVLRGVSPEVSEIDYRVLLDHQKFWSEQTDELSLSYEISVSIWLVPEDIRSLVCRLVNDLAIPETCGRLSFRFLYRLDDWEVLIRARERIQPDTTILLERWIGDYLWSEYYAEQKGGGTIELLKDQGGRPLEPRLRFIFDHRRCPPSAQEQD